MIGPGDPRRRRPADPELPEADPGRPDGSSTDGCRSRRGRREIRVAGFDSAGSAADESSATCGGLRFADGAHGLFTLSWPGKQGAAGSRLALLRSAIHVGASRGACPAEALSRFNREWGPELDDSGSHAAVCVIKVNGPRRCIEYASGGHPRPLVVRADGSIALLDAGGAAVGRFPHSTYRPSRLRLAIGDSVILHTVDLEPRSTLPSQALGSLMEFVVSSEASSAAELRDTTLDGLRAIGAVESSAVVALRATHRDEEKP